jgi:hypothetical protein
MNRGKYRGIPKKGWSQTAFLILIFITLGLFFIFLFPDYWYLWLLIIGGGLALLVVWHTKNFAYRCPRCDKVFEVSAIEEFLGPTGINAKYLKCPKCGKRAWVEMLRIQEHAALRGKLLSEKQNNTGHEKGEG